MSLAAADKWIYGTLSADAAMKALVGDPARVFDTLAPEGTMLPAVVFQFQGGSDLRGNGPGRILISAVYVVKAIGQGASFSIVQAIADRIDDLLQGQYGANDKGQNWAVREQPFKLIEITEGIQYRHLGGIYRVWTQEA